MPLQRLWLLVVALLWSGCSSSPYPEDPNRYPTWPYPGIQVLTQYPYELTQGSALAGSWISGVPEGHSALAEATLPNYVISLPTTDAGRSLLFDLGPGTRVENLAYTHDNRLLLAAAMESSPAEGSSILTRALLEIDRFQVTLLSATPMPRDRKPRGMTVTDRGRVYLYLSNGSGEGRVRALDKYSGLLLGDRSVGSIPAAVGRKGLTASRDGRFVFCLAGGQSSVSDFTPVSEQEGEPELVVLSGDSLGVVERVELPGDYEPQAVFHHEIRERVYVLASNSRSSRIYEIDAIFHRLRTVIDLPSPVTDLALTEFYGFAPAANGLYTIDLGNGGFTAMPGLPFTDTGEIVVTPDGRLGLVRFFSSYQGGGPGIAVLDLAAGGLREVWN